ncbi:MAG: hypothetical protein Q8P07_05325 [bacterium]|nr:hypothetical protein [bacterium]
MHLNGNVNKTLIERCLNQVEIFFEMGVVNREAANELIRQSYLEVANAHEEILNDPGSAVDLLVEYFFKPLKNIIPEEFGFAAMLTVYMKKGLVYELKVTSREQMNALISCHVHDRDPLVSLVEDWLFVTRMDQKLKMLSEP